MEDMQLSLGGKTFIDQVFEENLKERKIYFNQGVDESVVELIIAQILKWNTEDKNIPVEDRKEIILYISSLGGSVFEGLVLCDVIKASVTPIKAVALSYCYSMGGVIFVSCKKRYMFANSSLLIHDGNTTLSGSANKVKDLKKFYDKVDERLKDVIVSNSNITSEEYDDNADRELYLLADECKEKGLCDYIVGIDCDINEVI